MAYYKCGSVYTTQNSNVGINSASGDIASFQTNLAMALNKLKISFSAVQDLSGGDPSPSNPKPITGFSQADVIRMGANLWDEVLEKGTIDNTTGALSPANTLYRSKNIINIKPNTTYYVSSNYGMLAYYYDINMNYLGYVDNVGNVVKKLTTHSQAYYMRIRMFSNVSDVTTVKTSINYPATDTAYHAYNGNTYLLQFGDTYYGCEIDVVHGKLRATHQKVTLNGDTPESDLGITTTTGYTQIGWHPYMTLGKGTEVFKSDTFENVLATNKGLYKIWNNRNLATPAPRMFLGLPDTVTNATQAVAWFANNPTTVIFELATPIEVDIDSAIITALTGEVNNVYCDIPTSEVELQYKAVNL